MKKGTKEKWKRSGNIIKEYILLTLCPFVIPFLNEIPDQYMAAEIKAVMILVCIGLLSFVSIRFLLRNYEEKKNKMDYQIARQSLSAATDVVVEKRNALLQNLSASQSADFSYDVHRYIETICKNITDLVAGVTHMKKEHLHTTFIYHYTFPEATAEEKEWKWVTGKGLTTQEKLNEFIKKKDTAFAYLIEIDEPSLYSNDKKKLEKEHHYTMSDRDKNYEGVGSIFTAKLLFSSYGENYVEGILTISSYGAQFVSDSTYQGTPEGFRNLFMEEIFPYFSHLLECELGFLYKRHLKKEAAGSGTQAQS